MRKTLLLLLVATLALFGCKAKEQLDKINIAKDLEKRGTTDLMKEAAEDEYTAPEDQRLTEAQVQMYLKVREHEKQIAQVAKDELKKHAEESEKKGGDKSLSGMMEGFKAMGSVADVLTADIRAAKDLGYNSAEYQWVKGKVLEASGADMQQKMQQATASMMDSSYQQMKKQYDEAKDETSKKMLGEMLANYEKSRQEMQSQQAQVEPHVAYNRQLLSKHENALNAIAHELSKWEDKPGEAQKGVQEFQQNLDKAVTDAQKQTQ